MGTTLTTVSKFLLLAFAAQMLPCVYAWTPGVGSESSSSGFTVDTHSRNDVISFWNSVYKESEGYENLINWTGSISSGNPGDTSASFKAAVERRINYYRAMAGMTANIKVSSSSLVVSDGSGPVAPAGTTKQEAAQAAALMLSSNSDAFLPTGAVASGAADPHSPPSNWSLDSNTARNGARYGNLAIGTYGPGAIDAYMSEDDQAAAGEENTDVGHRRYLLHSRVSEVATGDVTGTGSNYFEANALYIAGDWLAPTNSPQFVSWPNPGFIPEAIVPDRWSLSYPGANFSSASITMKNKSGNTISTSVISRNATYADNTIVWKPAPSSMPSAEYEDMTYDVTISDIFINGNRTSHSFSVTVINPNRLNEYPVLSGNTSPPASGANFYFNQIDHAEEYELDVSKQVPVNWTEGAEDSVSGYIADGTSNSYELRSSFTWSNYNGQRFWDTGNKAFRLAFTDNILPLPTETFTINRTVIPKPGASLSFRLCRGYMTPNTILEVQYSGDGGGAWTSLSTYSGSGNGTPDNSFVTKNVNLSSTSDQILIRFLFHQPSPTGVYDVTTYPNYPVGVFIDNITLSNCDWFENLGQTRLPATSSFVTLDEASGGGPLQAGSGYLMRVRPKIGTDWLPYGPSLTVVPETGQVAMESKAVSDILGTDVMVTVNPESGVSVYSVEESIPTGLEPLAINEGGVWDSSNRKVVWGPFFDATPRILSYSLEGVEGNYVLAGTGNFDGSNISVIGERGLAIARGDGINSPNDPADSPGSNPAFAGAGSGGTYNGFLASADGQSTLGYFKNIKVAATGKLSAKLYFGSASYSLKGQFDENGRYQDVITPKKGSPAEVDLQLVKTDGGGYKIEGTVIVDAVEATVNAVKSGSTGGLSGAYTLLIPAVKDESSAPQGHGYGLMTVSSSGTATIKGVLGDGSKWSAKCLVTPDGEMPLYASLYKKAGSLGGMVRFRDLEGVSDCDGEMHWQGPGLDLQRQLIGSRFDHTSGQRLIDSTPGSLPNVLAYIGEGSGADASELEFEWTASNRITYLGSEKIKLKASTKNGQIKGSAPIDGGKWKVEGVVFQKQGMSAGLLSARGKQPRSMIMIPAE